MKEKKKEVFEKDMLFIRKAYALAFEQIEKDLHNLRESNNQRGVYEFLSGLVYADSIANNVRFIKETEKRSTAIYRAYHALN